MHNDSYYIWDETPDNNVYLLSYKKKCSFMYTVSDLIYVQFCSYQSTKHTNVTNTKVYYLVPTHFRGVKPSTATYVSALP